MLFKLIHLFHWYAWYKDNLYFICLCFSEHNIFGIDFEKLHMKTLRLRTNF